MALKYIFKYCISHAACCFADPAGITNTKSGLKSIVNALDTVWVKCLDKIAFGFQPFFCTINFV